MHTAALQELRQCQGFAADAFAQWSIVHPTTLGNRVAMACCRPRMQWDQADVLRQQQKKPAPYALTTVQSRYHQFVFAANRLRPHAKAAPQQTSPGWHFIKQAQTFKDFGLVKVTNHSRSFAPFENVLNFVCVAMCGLVGMAMTGLGLLHSSMERLQLCAMICLLLPTLDFATFPLQQGTMNIVSASVGAMSSSSSASSRASQRSARTSKTSSRFYRSFVVYSTPNLPAAADLSRLFATMALEDGAFLNIKDARGLDPELYAHLIDPATKCVLLPMDPDKAKLPIFRRIVQEADGWSVGHEPVRRRIIKQAFNKVRAFCCPGLVPYSLRRGTAAATAVSVTSVLQSKAHGHKNDPKFHRALREAMRHRWPTSKPYGTLALRDRHHRDINQLKGQYIALSSTQRRNCLTPPTLWHSLPSWPCETRPLKAAAAPPTSTPPSTPTSSTQQRSASYWT